MGDNEKWAWFNEDEQIPALFRPEPSTSKTDVTGLHLDVMAPDAAKTPANSAALGQGHSLAPGGQDRGGVEGTVGGDRER